MGEGKGNEGTLHAAPVGEIDPPLNCPSSSMYTNSSTHPTYFAEKRSEWERSGVEKEQSTYFRLHAGALEGQIITTLYAITHYYPHTITRVAVKSRRYPLSVTDTGAWWKGRKLAAGSNVVAGDGWIEVMSQNHRTMPWTWKER